MKLKKKMLFLSITGAIMLPTVVSITNNSKNIQITNDKIAHKNGLNALDQVITTKQVSDYMKIVTNTIKFEGFSSAGYAQNNATLNAGLKGINLKFGWTNFPNTKPGSYASNYKNLLGLQNNSYYWIQIAPQSGYTLQSGTPTEYMIKQVVGIISKSPFDQNSIFYGPSSAHIGDRQYKLCLSLTETTYLYNRIYNINNNVKIGDGIFNYLTTSWSQWNNLNVIVSYYSDSNSIRTLLENTNPHFISSKRFNGLIFLKDLRNDIKLGYPMTFEFDVIYEFLAHNKYGAIYTIVK